MNNYQLVHFTMMVLLQNAYISILIVFSSKVRVVAGRCISPKVGMAGWDFKIFVDKRIKEVFATDFLISCPNAPDCDGTVIDWVSIDD
jgi:hypothetical protein